MPPKRRDREGEGSKNGKIDHMQDHELFLQAFESKLLMKKKYYCAFFLKGFIFIHILQ